MAFRTGGVTFDLGTAVAVIAIGFSLFHLWWSAVGTLATLQLVYVHLGFALCLIFLRSPLKVGAGLERYGRALDAGLIVAAITACAYPVINYLEIARRGTGDPSDLVVALGIVTVLLVLEATRRIVGWPLALLAIAFIVYGFVGPYMPGALAHRGAGIGRIASSLYISPLGIAGTPLQVSATYIAIFVIFAAFLDVTGIGRFFIDWCYGLLGWMRGGPAKVAVAASALMGTVSGSAVANVVASGTFTIPLMKRSGLKPAFAAAVEAAASSGGQIMPPVMGAAAFIMMEILGVPYTTIMAAALIPGLLYFLAVLAMVDFEVGRRGIPGVPRAELPDAWAIFLRQGHLFLPLVLLLVLLVFVQYTPIKAAFYGVLSVLVIPVLRRETWFAPRALIDGLRNGGFAMLEVAAACACAGIIVGMMMLSGLALRLSGLLIDLSGGHLSILLVLTMIVSIILGMGMPTSAVYVILATTVVPAIITMGVEPLAAHLFVFYFGVMSNVTPPVAIAAYAAASLAGASLSQAGILAFRLALAGFLLPFMWIYNPALLMLGDLLNVTWAVVTATAGILLLAGAVQGFAFVWVLLWHERVLLLAAALSIIKPGLLTDAAGAALAGLAMASLLWRARLRRSQARPVSQEPSA